MAKHIKPSLTTIFEDGVAMTRCKPTKSAEVELCWEGSIEEDGPNRL